MTRLIDWTVRGERFFVVGDKDDEHARAATKMEGTRFGGKLCHSPLLFERLDANRPKTDDSSYYELIGLHHARLKEEFNHRRTQCTYSEEEKHC